MFHHVLITQYLVFQQHAKIALRPGDDGIISGIINVLQPGGVTSGSDKLCSNLSRYTTTAAITTLTMHASLHIITTQYCSSFQQFTYYYGYEHLVSAFTQSDYSRVFHGLGTPVTKTFEHSQKPDIVVCSSTTVYNNSCQQRSSTTEFNNNLQQQSITTIVNNALQQQSSTTVNNSCQ